MRNDPPLIEALKETDRWFLAEVICRGRVKEAWGKSWEGRMPKFPRSEKELRAYQHNPVAEIDLALASADELIASFDGEGPVPSSVAASPDRSGPVTDARVTLGTTETSGNRASPSVSGRGQPSPDRIATETTEPNADKDKLSEMLADATISSTGGSHPHVIIECRNVVHARDIHNALEATAIRSLGDRG